MIIQKELQGHTKYSVGIQGAPRKSRKRKANHA